MANLTLTLPQAMMRALTAYQAGKLAEAETICKAILEAKSDQFDALHLLAIVQARSGRTNEALASFGLALAIQPDHVDALNNRAAILLAIKRFEEALASCDRALAIKPDHAGALANRAAVLLGMKHSESPLAKDQQASALTTATASDAPWWTEPFNSQLLRKELVRQIILQCKIERIIETGTFLGATTEFFAHFGVPVITAEINPDAPRKAAARLNKHRNVTLRPYDSIRVFQELSQEPIDRSVPTLFYLDAHWEKHLPLLDEVELAVLNFPKAVIVIDDFCVQGDPGYAFDDYGPGKCLTLEYLLKANIAEPAVYFPSTPSNQETGARRGCVVLTENMALASVLDQITLLRKWKNDLTRVHSVTPISVVIPSRLDRVAGGGRFFLEDAIKSIRAQTIADRVRTQIVVGIDAGTVAPAGLAEQLDIEFIVSGGRSQAAALNAAAAHVEGDYLAVLEDDDTWNAAFLGTALRALSEAEFASSTQLEVDEQGQVLHINDFPTPSGWIMRRATFQAVGPFSETYRWHLDNDWLGRLAETAHRRVHIVEATAPVDPTLVGRIRPWLGNVLRQGGPAVRLWRHNYLMPLVVRRVHLGSGTRRIEGDPILKAESESELAQLKRRFGRIPW